ncbi:MAG: hypothetical protein CLLPBCKN_006989 [Chroococcidiopsis cubana SAG 39.79]|uniref:Major facilitator superfamily (MFS) profile domain-containing protein n=1 Tax=Chroococcidiopsis cubana SAG 39.79 TaxID=388085 RepID=A0AB37U8F3_9CYAN|nr:hypothetical protein [Chroococcidiopsis cubana]MDZ4877554.1 hypothetical protein [Chroococcidiopsis cubana SAG 39.79]RUS94681.1 hypothetical protein DSM107010_71720 [Chroococcidiopsis cubana SAG 39.79]
MKHDYTTNIAIYLCLTLFVHYFSNYIIPALQALTTPVEFVSQNFGVTA